VFVWLDINTEDISTYSWLEYFPVFWFLRFCCISGHCLNPYRM